ncbi:MAG: hypothetical protein V2I43_11730 [Parvularcula sp.]|jgi:hypothetical protein|nr:hypothetical protein [Parvularcula sp.]
MSWVWHFKIGLAGADCNLIEPCGSPKFLVCLDILVVMQTQARRPLSTDFDTAGTARNNVAAGTTRSLSAHGPEDSAVSNWRVAGCMVHASEDAVGIRRLIHALRSFVAKRLGIMDERAANGEWWETDLVIAFLGAMLLLGAISYFQLYSG